MLTPHTIPTPYYTHLPSGSLDAISVRFVVGEVIAALCSVHDAGFVYGDLKPENILLKVWYSGTNN